MNSLPRKLLVLDLDETLVHAREAALAHPEDFRVGPYFVYQRPHLGEFIRDALLHFSVAVWTSSGASYATQVVERIFPPGTLQFLWSSRRRTTSRDWTTGTFTTFKRLSKVKRQSYALANVIAVDDTPSKYARSYGNLVTVREFNGERDDVELRHLMQYLRLLLPVADVRTVEKRHWRSQVCWKPTPDEEP